MTDLTLDIANAVAEESEDEAGVIARDELEDDVSGSTSYSQAFAS